MRNRSDAALKLKLPDGDVRLDESGYLLDPEDWRPEVAERMAQAEGIRLEREHWQVLDYIREFSEWGGMCPDALNVYVFLAKRSGCDVAEARLRFVRLFPYGYDKQACRIAGLRPQVLKHAG